jgi:hypothetical protein
MDAHTYYFITSFILALIYIWAEPLIFGQWRMYVKFIFGLNKIKENGNARTHES